jgi:hypothetical protein
MFLTIPDTLLHTALQQHDGHNPPHGMLYGRRVDDGDVVQVIGLHERDGIALGQWLHHEPLDPDALPAVPALQPGEVLVLVATQPHLRIGAYQRTTREGEPPQLVPIESNIIRLQYDYTSRIRGLFEVDHLAHMCVVIIGLGTGGSVVASQLARCGVGRMRLVDFDRLEVHNITRHVCGLSDIGRYKTHAMRDHLLNISPVIQVETWEADVVAQEAVMERILDGCDLVIAATDSEQSKIAINHACWSRGVPAIYAAAYNRAFGGDVFQALPPDGACYACFHEVVTEFFGPPPAATDDFSIGYADPSQMADLVAEPGLGMDAAMIALIMTRMALMTLLRGSPTTLPPFPTNWVLFGNRAEWVFEKPLESIFVDVPKRPDCPTCNYEAYVQQNLGTTPHEAAEVAEEILSDVSEVESPLERRQHPPQC